MLGMSGVCIWPAASMLWNWMLLRMCCQCRSHATWADSPQVTFSQTVILQNCWNGCVQSTDRPPLHTPMTFSEL